MTEATTAFRERRIDLGMTQQDLADRCTELGTEVGDSQISKLERGLCTPAPGLRYSLRKILGADPVALAAKQVETVSGVTP